MASFCYNKVYLIELFPIPFWLIDVTVIAEAVDRITEMICNDFAQFRMAKKNARTIEIQTLHNSIIHIPSYERIVSYPSAIIFSLII
jgi:hypothetical protein